MVAIRTNPETAPGPMMVRLSGRVSVPVRPRQLPNTSSLSLVMVSGNTREVRPTQLWNAVQPMFVTESGSTRAPSSPQQLCGMRVHMHVSAFA